MANMYIIWDKLYIIDLLVRAKWIRYWIINQIVPVVLCNIIFTQNMDYFLIQKFILSLCRLKLLELVSSTFKTNI